jgi:hypothetical protein
MAKLLRMVTGSYFGALEETVLGFRKSKTCMHDAVSGWRQGAAAAKAALRPQRAHRPHGSGLS